MGISAGTGGYTNIKSNAKINIVTEGEYGHGLWNYIDSTINIKDGAQINIAAMGKQSCGIAVWTNSVINISGILNIKANFCGIRLSVSSSNVVNVDASAKIYFNMANEEAIVNYRDGGTGANLLDITQGAQLAIEKDGNTKWYELGQDYRDENTSTSATNYITASNITTVIPGISETTPWTLPTGIEADEEDNTAKKNIAEYQSQFNSVLGEYNKLINDCSYQGINLLKGGNLKVVFNEHRSNVFNVLGQDITAASIGLNEALWQTTGDINRSVSELTQAITTLRSLAESLGNQYSIIQTRADFTEGLTDILETGADDLTLADMNEASAQYLSLQTRQQLALNSLSLAAQSAQSVLSLFN